MKKMSKDSLICGILGKSCPKNFEQSTFLPNSEEKLDITEYGMDFGCGKQVQVRDSRIIALRRLKDIGDSIIGYQTSGRREEDTIFLCIIEKYHLANFSLVWCRDRPLQERSYTVVMIEALPDLILPSSFLTNFCTLMNAIC